MKDENLKNYDNLLYVNDDNILKIKNIDLKTEFLAIQENAKNKPLTKVLIEEIDYKYKELLRSFGLEDLRYKIKQSKQSIIFIPIRPIDKYAVAGILTNK